MQSEEGERTGTAARAEAGLVQGRDDCEGKKKNEMYEIEHDGVLGSSGLIRSQGGAFYTLQVVPFTMSCLELRRYIYALLGPRREVWATEAGSDLFSVS